MFRIGLKRISIKAPIGYYEWEREEGREYTIDIDFLIDKDEILNDELNNTFNYEFAYHIILKAAEKKMKLIESFMEEIIREIKQQNSFKELREIHIKIRKLDPFRDGKTEAAIIERTYEI